MFPREQKPRNACLSRHAKRRRWQFHGIYHHRWLVAVSSLQARIKTTVWNDNVRFSHQRKNTNCSHQQAKLWALFWDRKGVIFLDILKLGLTIKTDCYITRLTNLKSRISRFIPEKSTTICLQCNHARFHNSLETMDHIFVRLPYHTQNIIWYGAFRILTVQPNGR